MPTMTKEFFLVAYFMAEYDEICSWCEHRATVRIEATPDKLGDFACADCAAGHLRSNADVIDGTV